MSDAPDTGADAPSDATTTVADPLEDYAAALADRVGAIGHVVEFGTVRILVDADRWVETIVDANKDLPFFSWLSAIDWSKDVQVGDGVDDPDSLDERFEVICRLSSVENSDGAHFVASLPREKPTIGSLTPHIGGAAWHEREAHEMFGIMFDGNDHLVPLYLPDDFQGNPLLKSYPLISREVKPWPGDVDVEGMPEVDPDGGAGAADEGEES
jgi:NADH-quinone oxidoreductase subunit C